ncbi:hypothetical protein KIF53_03870 [Chromobacterium subtsugae]|uniref:GCVT N-terminal domain-containing protein n=1 Tax=Chromobacterium subtsugae TaxID=251747 RepID=A0ABS7F9P7_9NEIS|nr:MULTISPECIES: folate-binding protein YgfZ [Chromobacterium]KUM02514.1 hypothetical protein Cv017_01975 [Chromobacterium subtsugae]KZE87899.1 hypothetical protein AWB61_08810 [Chromobacterium sp. F49]MBW7565392.1 folate-binding protein YgfZ [Chromobacterium subtsugae]MBW8286757.1 hypothetical protein [Chromobacterium subtsugae]WSE90765.1 folate-binding protein YgfZ [Chromobacterium subtsugae]
MDAFWNEWLGQKGLASDGELPLGERLSQVEALLRQSVLAPLANFAVIKAEGEDAAAFLQSQLSSDIRELVEGRAQYSTYSSAKGRMLASFMIWQHQGAYYLMVAADIAAAIVKRLTMFVLRSKVKISLADEWSLLGMSGPQAVETLRKYFPGVAGLESLQTLSADGAVLLALPEGGFMLALGENASLRQDIAAAELRPLAPEIWALRDINAGIAWVSQATQEQFVPQMANMELIGAVNFKKGCYPGQEIVARSQYLGKMKRRMFLVEFSQALAVGSKLYSPQLPDQSIGMLAASCQVAEDRYRGLAVVQSQTWSSGIFGDEAGTIALTALELPYALESVTE